MAKRVFFGLGNPGPMYEGTRHNLGAAVLRAWEERATHDVLARVWCLYPEASMNESGQALSAFMRASLVAVEDVLVIHDDLELPLGSVDLAEGGSAKGHNGVRSIHSVLSTQDVPRLRLGIGRPPDGMAVRDFVLGRFGNEEKERVEEMVEEAAEELNEMAAS